MRRHMRKMSGALNYDASLRKEMSENVESTSKSMENLNDARLQSRWIRRDVSINDESQFPSGSGEFLNSPSIARAIFAAIRLINCVRRRSFSETRIARE